MRNPWWLTLLTVLASIWLGVWFLVSWASSLGVACGADDLCQQRADTGWAVLMGTQLLGGIAAVVALARRRWRPWGIGLALVLSPAAFLVVTRIYYPPGYSL
ncbi:MAG TPA: hypothetical protein VHL78_12835 [Actinomycetota bacterium]|nr:hypothetical protein [Actinomycetota bacterium]